MLITIYDSTGTPKAELSPNDSSTQVKEIQGDSFLTLSFTHYDHISLDVDDYVDFEGERFWLTEQYRPRQNARKEWVYDIKLYGVESMLKRLLVIKTVDDEDDPVFTLTAPPHEHVAMIVKCMNTGLGNITDWKAGQVEGTENIVIDYFGKYCDEALKEIAEKVGAEAWVEGQTVNICRCEHGEPIPMGYDKGLLSIDPGTADNVKFYTRLYPVGSSRNIDREKYGYSRLQLPGGQKYVEINADKYGRVDHYEADAFADIYPRRTGIVSNVRSEVKTGEDGKPFTIYYFSDNSLPFDPNAYEIGGLVKRVSFQEGSELAGLGEEDNGTYFFEVNFNSSTREFEIITIWPYDNDMQLPGDKLIPKIGDKYILWNLRMPDEYYELAEAEFMSAVDKYNADHNLDISVYKAPTDHVWIEDNEVVLTIGQRIRLESDEYFPETGYRDSRITKITRKVNLPSSMDIEISDTLSRTSLQKVSDSISEVRSYAEGIAGSVALPDIIRTGDNTRPTDNNLLSAKRTYADLLRRDRDERTTGKVSSDKGFEVGNYVSGVSGGMLGMDSDGDSFAEVARLYVRVKAFFEELTVVKANVLAGKQYLTPGGGIKCVKVEEIFSPGNKQLTGWRCYFLSEQDGEKTYTKIIPQDQAICQEFNAEPGTSQKVSNHYFWRLVTAVNNDAYTDENTGNRYGYVELSKSDCDTGSDAPKEGDEICQLGYRGSGNRERQTAMVFSTVDADAPSMKLFSGINSYSLADKAVISFGRDPQSGELYFRLGNSSAKQYLDYTQDGGLKIAGSISSLSTYNDGSGDDKTLGDVISDRITDTDVLYIQSASNAKAPALPTVNTSGEITNMNGWSTDAPEWKADKYIWQTTYVKKGDGSATFSAPTCISGRNGVNGVDGKQGPQGVQGPPGADGKATYTWIRYADDAQGNGISNSPTGKKYIGFAYNKTTATESNTPSDYKWSKIEGPQGVQGEKGADGKQYYTWIKYSDNADGTGLYDIPNANTKYIGIAVNKLTATESTNKGDYTWSLFRGADGTNVTITSQSVKYSTAHTATRPADSTFTLNDVPTLTAGQYLWSMTTVTYSNGQSTKSYAVSRVGADGANGAQGYSVVANVPRPNFTEAKWNTYGTTGHVENWTNTENIRNGCRIGDYFKIYGTATDTGNSHVLVYKSDTASGTLHGECVSHEIAEAGESISITNTSVTYAKTTNATQPADSAFTYTSIGAANLKAGEYLWTKTEVSYSDGNSTKSYTVSRIGSDGDDGLPGAPGADGKTPYVHYAYANSANGATGFSTTYFNGALYVGVCTDYNQTDPTDYTKYEWARLKGEDGTPAKVVVVNSDATAFVYSDNFATLVGPSAINLSATLQGTTGYQWSYKKEGATSFANISGATSATLAVAATNSTYFPSGAKSCTFRCTSGGVYDEVTIVKVSSGSNGTNGTNGTNGQDAYTVLLTNESHIFEGDTEKAIAGSTESAVIAYKGATQVAATIGTITGMPTGMTVDVANNGTTSAKFTVTVANALTTKQGTLTVPVTVDGKTFTQVFSWSLSLKGKDGRGIVSVVEEYAIHTSGSTAPAESAFSTDMPTMTDAKPYLWNREITTYTDNTQSDPTPAVCIGAKGQNGAAGATVVSVTNYYLASAKASGVKSTDAGWVTDASATNAQTSADKPYLWNYEVTKWSKGADTSTAPHVVGTFGSGYTDNLLLRTDVPVSNGSYLMKTYKLAETPVVGETYTFTLWGQLAATKTNFGIWNSGGMVKLADLKKIEDEKYSAVFKWVNTSGSSTAADTSIQIYTLTSSQSGTSSINHVKLEKGANANPQWNPNAKEMQTPTFKEQYYLSTSNTTQTGGSWEDKAPTWQAGKYIWTRTKITYATGDVEYTDPVCATGDTGTSVLAEYSADGTNWHPAYQAGDIWMRTGTDGVNWNPAVRIQGANYAPNLVRGSKSSWGNPGTDHGSRCEWTNTINSDGFKEFTQTLKVAGGNHNGYVFITNWLERENLKATFVKGKTYTLSFEYKSPNVGVQACIGRNINGTWGSNGYTNFPASTDWVRVAKTFVWDVDTTNSTFGNATIYFNIQYNIGAVGDTASFRKFCIVEGDSSAYVPAESEMVGKDGPWRKFQWAVNNSTTTAPTSGWQDAPMTAPAGQYVWMRSGMVTPPATNPATWETATRITGDKGATGDSVYLLDMDNEVIAISCDVAGNVIEPTNPRVNLKVFKGGSLDSGWTFSIPNGGAVGCTAHLEGAILSVDSIIADVASVTVQATKSGLATLTATLSLYKVKPGGSYQPNLLLGTKDGFLAPGNYVPTTQWAHCFKVPFEDGTVLNVGDKIAISFESIKAVKGGATSFTIGLYSLDANKQYGTELANAFEISSSKLTGVMTIKAATPAGHYPALLLYPALNGQLVGCQAQYGRVMAVKGETPMDWSPAASEMEGAVVYQIEPNVDNITKSMDGKLTATTITCSVYKVTGDKARELTSEKALSYQRIVNGAVQASDNLAHTNGVSTAVSVTDDTEAIIFELKDGNVVLDRERVPVLSDASDIEVGMRNLLRDSKSITINNPSNSVNAYESRGITQILEKDKSYIFKIKEPLNYQGQSIKTGIMHIAIVNAAGSSTLMELNMDVAQKILKFKPTANIPASSVIRFYGSGATSGTLLSLTRVYLAEVMLVQGNVAPTGWNPAPEDVTAAIGKNDYLADALKEDSKTEGGLILVSTVSLGQNNTDYTSQTTWSGMNGIYKDAAVGGGIAAWYGGDMYDLAEYYNWNDAEGKWIAKSGVTVPSRIAKGVDRMDGSGYRAGGNLWWDDSGLHANGTFTGHMTVGNQNGQRIDLDPLQKVMNIFDSSGTLVATHSGRTLTVSEAQPGNTQNATGTATVAAVSTNLTVASGSMATKNEERSICSGTAANSGTLSIDIPSFILRATTDKVSSLTEVQPSASIDLYLVITIGTNKMEYALGMATSFGTVEEITTPAKNYQIPIPKGSAYNAKIVAKCSLAGGTNKKGTLSCNSKSIPYKLVTQAYRCEYGANGWVISLNSLNYAYLIVESGKLHFKVVSEGKTVISS